MITNDLFTADLESAVDRQNRERENTRILVLEFLSKISAKSALVRFSIPYLQGWILGKTGNEVSYLTLTEVLSGMKEVEITGEQQIWYSFRIRG